MSNDILRRGRGAAALLAALLAAGGMAAADAATDTATPESPALGDTLPPFEAQGLDGVVQSIDYPKGSPTILLFFLSGCPVCHRMIPEWNKAYERRAKGLRVIGVLMDQEPPGFFMATPISFPVVRSPGIQFLRRLKVNRAPLTLRVAPGGVVQDVGLGALDGIRLGEIFRP
jgi:Redoxin